MTNKKIIANFMWSFIERWGAQGVTLIVSLVLARILGPEVFGTLALVMVFTTILQVFVDSGLGTALIQKKDVDDLDFSSVFWFNLVSCLTLYLIMFFLAPIISSFYNRPELISIIRVLNLVLVVSGVKNIQQAYVSRNLLFKKFFFSTLSGTVIAATVGIIMAYKGFGVWALIAQHLFNTVIDTTILWITVKWRPQFVFSWSRFVTLFSYGSKMLVSSLIDTIYNQIRSLIIGKYYTSKDLAFYIKGEQFPNYAVQNINSSMNSVFFPVLSQKQDDISSLKRLTRKMICISSYIIWPMMIGLFVVADKFITIFLTNEWNDSIIFIRILCFSYLLQPLQTTNLSVIKALGKSDIHLTIEIIKKTIAIVIVMITASFGVKMIAIGSVVYSIIATIINSYPNKTLINYSYFEQIKDIFPSVWMSIVMGVITFSVGQIPVNIRISFLLQIITGVLSYISISICTKNDSFFYIKEKLIKQLLSGKKR